MVRINRLLLGTLIAAVCAFPAFAQENATEQQQPAAAAAPDLQWLWGEVISVNPQEQSMSVKYLDYDSDMEKTIELVSDAGTKFEEVKGLDEIKPQDTVSIEYLVKDGKNVARGITVERIEETDIGEGEPPTAAPEKVGTGPIPVPEKVGDAPSDAEAPK
jgi:hypothetical protein